jgi:hypothetical protein
MDESRNLFIADRGGTPGLGLIVEAGKTLSEETTTPLAHGVIGDAKFPGNGGVVQAVTGQEDDPGSLRQSLG